MALSSSSSSKTDLRSLVQLYYYNNYGGTVRFVSQDELAAHEKDFLKTFREFRVPADNDKVLLAFKPHDTSHPVFPESSVFCIFDSADKLARYCAERGISVAANKSSAHPVWLTLRDVLLSDVHDLSFGSAAQLLLEVGRDGLFHIPSKKVARCVKNGVSPAQPIPVRAAHKYES